MPYYDGTGPMGTGPWGRGLGPCHAGGRMGGAGNRMFMGRGHRNMGFYGRPKFNYDEVHEAPSTEEVRKNLELEVEMLENRLKALKAQMQDMGSDPQ